MKRKAVNAIFLVTILVLALTIFIYKLGVIPNGFYVDEAAVAYNAYSILETGRDAFGQSYPILFRLLGSYTPPLYIYISALFVKFFGIGVITFRMISVASALISIIFFYLFTKKLNIFKSNASYLVATFFYAISPWLVFNARLGYEVTLAYLLFNIGVYFLFVAMDVPKYFILSAVFLSLSTYTAHTQRFLAPIFVLLYLLIFQKNIFKKNSFRFLAAALGTTLVIQIPHFMVITTPAFWVKNQRLFEGGGRIAKNIFDQVMTYLSTKNLFYSLEDIDQQHIIPEISVMYKWMVIPFLTGVFILFNKLKERSYKYLGLLFITSLIPAVLSGEFISIQRALPFLLPLSIVIGIGIDKIGNYLKCTLSVVIFLAVTFYSLLMLYRSYLILFPIEQAGAWNYGYSQLSEFIGSNKNEHFLVDNSRNPRNYILLLYYLRYPPHIYQNEVDTKYKTDYYRSLPTENNYKFSNIEVREINWEKDSYIDQIIVGDPLSISSSQANEHFLDKIYEINDPKNNPLLIFYRTNPRKKCLISYVDKLCLRD